jgi:molybdopterin-guanine dinucleotide biosynthesis protein B
MRKIVGLVGSSGSGKTTLIEKLVPQLKQRGYRVGTVKHAGHGFEMDREGKDTWRYQQSGADSVIVSSPGKMVLSRQGIPDRLHAILPFLADMDIVLVEGFKKEPIPKIEVFRSAVAQSPLCLSDPRLQAVVSDDVLQTGIPIIGLEDVERIVTLIEGLPDEEMSGLGE